MGWFQFIRKRKWLSSAVCCLAVVSIVTSCHLPYYLAKSPKLTTVSPEIPTTPVADRLKVSAFNIAHGRGNQPGGPNWNQESKEARLARLGEIRTLLQKQKADVVILNEVDFDCSWSYGIDFPEILSKGLYRFFVSQQNYGAGLLWRHWRFGNCILTNLQPEWARHVSLPAHKPAEALFFGKKDALLVQFGKARDKRAFRLLALHLEVRDAEARRLAAEKVIKIAQSSPIPMIVAGDMNSSLSNNTHEGPSDQENQSALDILIDSGIWQAAHGPSNFTFPGASPNRQIDWILVPKSFDVEDSTTVATGLSDHCYIEADLSLTE